MKELPKFLEKYFWDVDFGNLKKQEYPQFIIERILEYGNEKAIKWMRDNFTESEIKAVVCESRAISKKSANFWQLVFNIKRNNILCLKKSFQKKQGAIWNY